MKEIMNTYINLKQEKSEQLSLLRVFPELSGNQKKDTYKSIIKIEEEIKKMEITYPAIKKKYIILYNKNYCKKYYRQRKGGNKS